MRQIAIRLEGSHGLQSGGKQMFRGCARRNGRGPDNHVVFSPEQAMATSRSRNAGPDRDAALAQYRRRAAVYDLELLFFEPVRRQAVAWLAPRPGSAVLDVGCGTGLSLPLLRMAVGPTGRVFGIEQSPEMIERARRRVREHGWRNVSLVNAAAEDAAIDTRADAALLHFTHDVLQNEQAVDRVLRQLKPGAVVVASGLKWAPAWAVPVNLFVWPAALRSVSSLAGLHRPWRHLEQRIGRPELRHMLGGGVYAARFVLPPQP
jgi:ubiquinone/menaquinone biosynthesis C-methylase UbiE